MRIANLSRLYSGAIQWRDGILGDFCSALLEALFVLIISSLSLIAWSIKYGLETDGIGLLDAVITAIARTLQPTEVIIYVTAILSSTTAFFLVRLRLMRQHSKRLALIFLSTFVTIFLATPLFIAGLNSTPANMTLAANMAIVLGLTAVAVWIFSLFSQRRIVEKGSVLLSGDSRGREIAKTIENS